MSHPVRALLCAAVVAGLAGWARAQAAGEAADAKAPQGPRLQDYRHKHREAVKALGAGQFGQAVTWCLGNLQKQPGDAETLYFLAAAYAGQKDVAKATDAMRQAMDAGMPPSRFLVGPREWVKPFLADDAYREFRQKHGGGLMHGPILGCVTDRSARFWVRTLEETPVQVVVGTGAELASPVRSQPAATKAAADYTAVVEVAGLRPNTDYRYDVLVGGRSALSGQRPSFRTAPAAGEACRFTAAFGGGAAYHPALERMWPVLAGRKPDLFLQLGDNVYIDAPEEPDYQRYVYYRRQSQGDYRWLCMSTAVYAIYDDHDFGKDNCSGGPEVDEPAWKRPVWRLFGENWVNPYYGGGEAQPGCWFHFSRGDVDFILLDGRYYRTPLKAAPPDQRSMLGPAQKKWLLDTLKACKGAFKVICSPVPFEMMADADKWGGFPAEREEIFSFIEAHRIEGVVLLSADRHRSDVMRIPRPNGYDFWEFESSKLTNVHTHGVYKEAVFSYNEKCSFGLLTFDTAAAEPTVTCEIINIDDELVHTHVVKLAELRFRGSAGGARVP